MTGAWWQQGNCAELPEFTEAPPRVQVRICDGCPVRQVCLDEALKAEAQDPALPDRGWAVRGGLLGEERRQLLMKTRTRERRFIVAKAAS